MRYYTDSIPALISAFSLALLISHFVNFWLGWIAGVVYGSIVLFYMDRLKKNKNNIGEIKWIN